MARQDKHVYGITGCRPLRKGLGLSAKLGLITILGVLLGTSLLLLIPAFFPGVGAETADLLREVAGPQPVAQLESISFKFQDFFHRTLSGLNGGQKQISLSGESQSYAQANNQPLATETGSAGNNGSPATTADPAFPASEPNPTGAINPAASNHDVVSDAPQIGWQAYGPKVNQRPIMARALILLDPTRSYAGVALVRIDLSKTQLHIMPGFLEPSHSSKLVQTIPQLGIVPTNDQSNLVAAFNGGFKALHGHYGMMADRVPMLPPIPGMATIAVYQDGHIQLGSWGQNIQSSQEMIAYRQNCPPLIQSGQLNSSLYSDNRKAWGYTNNSDITWRTGIGLTQDNHYLIYAVGNGSSAATLAEALQKAGAYNAMQLDINQFYAHFYTYAPSDPSSSDGFTLTGQRLLDQMINNPHLYLTPYARDFFYLTTQ